MGLVGGLGATAAIGNQSIKVTEGNTAYIQKDRKTPLKASPSPPNIRQMWQSLRSESWSQPGAVKEGLKLNREAEEQVNAAVQHPAKKKPQPKAHPKHKP
jgi:hypothetical protein